LPRRRRWRAPAPDPIPLDRVEVLRCDLVTALAAAAARPRPRRRPPILPWSGLLGCVRRRATSQPALWRRLTTGGLWHFPRVAISDDALDKRLATDGPAPSERLFADLPARLVARRSARVDRTLVPWPSEVLAIDATAFDPVARTLPALRDVPRGDAALLPGQLAAGFALRRQLWRRIAHPADPRQNEEGAARALAAGWPATSRFVFDLSYCAFAWFDDLTDAGQGWVSRLREKTRYALIHTFYHQGDTLAALVWLGAHRADRAKRAVRLVPLRPGGTRRRDLTNVTAPRLLPMRERARVYARRGDIELAVNLVNTHLLVKTHLGLHLRWSAKAAVVLAQVWAVLIIARVVQAVRVEIAAAAAVDVFDVSRPLLGQYRPQYASRVSDPIAAFVADGRRVRCIRPSRRPRIDAPTVPDEADQPPPADLVVERTPRSAQRKGGSRATNAAS
jgi:hypothetical protein